MDYTKVKGLTIPKGLSSLVNLGKVSKITDSSGRVLWESDVMFSLEVTTYAKTYDLYVPSGSTWRDAAVIHDKWSTDDYKIYINEDAVWGTKVKLQFYYGGARVGTILDDSNNLVRPDDVIEAKIYYVKLD